MTWSRNSCEAHAVCAAACLQLMAASLLQLGVQKAPLLLQAAHLHSPSVDCSPSLPECLKVGHAMHCNLAQPGLNTPLGACSQVGRPDLGRSAGHANMQEQEHGHSTGPPAPPASLGTGRGRLPHRWHPASVCAPPAWPSRHWWCSCAVPCCPCPDSQSCMYRCHAAGKRRCSVSAPTSSISRRTSLSLPSRVRLTALDWRCTIRVKPEPKGCARPAS